VAAAPQHVPKVRPREIGAKKTPAHLASCRGRPESGQREELHGQHTPIGPIRALVAPACRQPRPSPDDRQRRCSVTATYRWGKPLGHWELLAPPADERFAVPVSELLAAGDRPPAEDGDHWGAWCYRTAPAVLVFEQNGRELYWIDLRECRTSAAVLDWIGQLHKKVWTTPADIGDLVHAFNDLFDLQATRCSFGVERSRPRGKCL
jgi:hypothetical protein